MIDPEDQSWANIRLSTENSFCSSHRLPHDEAQDSERNSTDKGPIAGPVSKLTLFWGPEWFLYDNHSNYSIIYPKIPIL